MLIEAGAHSTQHALDRDRRKDAKDGINHKSEIVADYGSKENKDHLDMQSYHVITDGTGNFVGRRRKRAVRGGNATPRFVGIRNKGGPKAKVLRRTANAKVDNRMFSVRTALCSGSLGCFTMMDAKRIGELSS